MKDLRQKLKVKLIFRGARAVWRLDLADFFVLFCICVCVLF